MTTAEETAISPFSISHEWTLHWKCLPSNLKRLPFFNDKSEKEQKAVEAISKVGLIGGQQLLHLFGINKKRLAKMVTEQKIVRHEMRLGNQVMPIYTLGLNGAMMAGIEEAYKMNYWLEYKTEDVLKRIVFFKLYEHFRKEGEGADDEGGQGYDILPTPKPFSGAIRFKGKPFYIYVLRGDANDLMMYMKWKGDAFNERLIVVTESLRYLEGLKPILQLLKVRVALDADLLQSVEHVQNLFYFLSDGQFVRDC